MTIKSHGGIFGRNPTFNNVTVDGTLTVDQIVEKTGAAGITLDGVTLKDGNVVLADGKGIDFSATAGTGTSELFDDYEEGTFTPTFTTTGTGFTSITYDYQIGLYTKIGNLVNFRISMRTSAATIGSASGLVLVSLPFSSSSAQGGACGPSRSFATSNPSAWVTTGANAYLTFKTAANGDFSYLAPANIATGASGNELRLSGSYTV